MTTTPTPQQVGRVQAAIDRILDGDADRYVGAYYNAEARSYPTAKGVLFAGRYFDELQTNNVRAFTVGDLAAASLLDVRFGPHVILELLEREECNTLLTDIPSDVPLWAATDEQLARNSAAWRLWTRLVSIPGVGTTTGARQSRLMRR